jgi:hypothetical protein
MSAPIHNRDLDNDLDHSSSVRIRDRRSNNFSGQKSRPRFSRKRGGPNQVNGIHRRRNKRSSW